MRIIGLTGRARSGKDTVAEIVGALLSDDLVVVREGFADKLKLSACRLFYPDATLAQALSWCEFVKTQGQLTVEDAKQVVGIDTTITGRQFLQRYGTEAHRSVFGEDFWLDAVLPEGRDDCDVLVIPDARFENEVKRVRERGGEVWRIERAAADSKDTHPSERPIPNDLVDHIVENNGTIDELRETIQRML